MTARAFSINFFINAIGAIVPLAIALVTVPIYIRHVGDARYGIISIVWVMLGYLGFLDLGLSRAAAHALARLRNAAQEARARVLVTSIVLNLALGLFGSLCLAIFGNYFLQHLLTMPPGLEPEVKRAFPWIVALFPLALISGVGIGALESRERFLLANVLQISGSSLGQIAPVVVAVMISPSLAVVVPIAAMARALTAAAVLLAVYRFERPLSLADFDRRQVRTLLSYGGWVSVSGVMAPILSSLDQFVIGSVLSLAAVTHYAVPMTLVTRSQVLASALSRTLFPRMSSVGPEEARIMASRALLLLAYGYGALCAPAIILIPVFLQHWIGAKFAEVAAPVAEILFLGAWINGLAFVPYCLLQSQGRPNLIGKFHVAEVLPFVGVLWALTSAFGIKGAAMAWSLRCAADAACLFWAAAMPRRTLFQAIVLPFCLLLVSYVVVGHLETDLQISLAVAAAIGLVGMSLALINSRDLRRRVLPLALRAGRAISNPSWPSLGRKI